MKGWVGLVGWPVVDSLGLPTLVVTHQLQVERKTGKVRQSETDVLPLCHATNWCNNQLFSGNHADSYTNVTNSTASVGT